MQHCNEQTTGWVILIAASATKTGPLKLFKLKLGFTSNFIELHPTRGGDLCTHTLSLSFTALSFSQHSCGDSLGCRSAKCSWPAGVANARRVPRWNGFCPFLFVLLFGVPGDNNNIQISLFFWCHVIWRFGNNAVSLLWKQNHTELYPAIIPFHAFHSVEVVLT